MRKEIPILFSTPMVQAILTGRKTMTRRVMNPQPPEDANGFDMGEYSSTATDRNGDFQEGPLIYGAIADTDFTCKCRYGKPGDLLWVREGFNVVKDGKPGTFYKADCGDSQQYKWKPSIHMPKAAARIWLEVKDVRVERLHEIKGRDAVAEGFNEPRPSGARHMTSARIDHEAYLERANKWFTSLWHSINGEESWNQNPWVWVVSFKVVSTTGKSNSTPNSETSVATDELNPD